MWLSKKKYQALEKRIADLEELVQSRLVSTKTIPISLNGENFFQAVRRAIDDNPSTSRETL